MQLHVRIRPMYHLYGITYDQPERNLYHGVNYQAEHDVEYRQLTREEVVKAIGAIVATVVVGFFLNKLLRSIF
jgi:hypothetical protein